jgi:hypothetical protein
MYTPPAMVRIDSVSMHEAGHAVVRCCLGIPFTHIHVEPGLIHDEESQVE